MPRKKIPVQTPGAAPVADAPTTEQAPQPQVEPRDPPVEPVPARKAPDAAAINSAVLTDRGWLCPSSPKAG